MTGSRTNNPKLDFSQLFFMIFWLAPRSFSKVGVGLIKMIIDWLMNNLSFLYILQLFRLLIFLNQSQ